MTELKSPRDLEAILKNLGISSRRAKAGAAAAWKAMGNEEPEPDPLAELNEFVALLRGEK